MCTVCASANVLHGVTQACELCRPDGCRSSYSSELDPEPGVHSSLVIPVLGKLRQEDWESEVSLVCAGRAFLYPHSSLSENLPSILEAPCLILRGEIRRYVYLSIIHAYTHTHFYIYAHICIYDCTHTNLQCVYIHILTYIRTYMQNTHKYFYMPVCEYTYACCLLDTCRLAMWEQYTLLSCLFVGLNTFCCWFSFLCHQTRLGLAFSQVSGVGLHPGFIFFFLSSRPQVYSQWKHLGKDHLQQPPCGRVCPMTVATLWLAKKG